MKKTAYLAALLLLVLFSFARLHALDFSQYAGLFENYPQTHVIIADKKEKMIYAVDSSLNTAAAFRISTGMNPENKAYAGDNATPEGSYVITEILEEDKPGSLLKAEAEAAECDENCADAESRLARLKKEHEKNRVKLAAMNKVYFKAKDGHKKWGTNLDLGRGAYGPVFMRLSYPEKNDIKRHESAKKRGYLPMRNDGSYPGPGSGIAIHGTNDPDSLGQDASSGCVRLLNEEALLLRKYAQKGTKVIIK